MDPLVKTALWQQFGATIDMLENALLACSEAHWNERIWDDHPDSPMPPGYATFWYVTYHTLFWLDLYLSGPSKEEFAPPPPFTLAELDPAGVLPERPYTREELHTYLVHLRKKCQTTLADLSDERAHQQVDYPWTRKVSFLELQLYNMRHVQEHTAQLSLFLGHHGVSDEALDWVPWAKTDKSGE